MNLNRESSYEDDIKKQLAKAAAELPAYEEAFWFLEQIGTRLTDFSPKRDRRVYVMGNHLPAELFAALDIAPVWLMGGSRKAAELADEGLPRDTDPVSRASYGYLSRLLKERGQHLIVIPCMNDNYRKLAYLLRREGKQVLAVTVPPVRTKQAVCEWERQMSLLAEALSRFVRRRLSPRRLSEAAALTKKMREELHLFEKLADYHPQSLSCIFRMLIPFSIYCTDDWKEWVQRMHRLNTRIAGTVSEGSRGSRVLLLGSPVFFPNYKIPFLLQETGMELAKDFTFSALQGDPGKRADFPSLCESFFSEDCSPAYAQNDGLFRAVSEYMKLHRPAGVIYHVLKGQIEYDFELERFEELFAEKQIPMVRLETDYSDQDIEQLRLRIEAFSEIIGQQAFRKGGKG